MKALVAAIVRWGWWQQLLTGWLLGMGSAVVIAIGVALTVSAEFPAGFYGLYALLPLGGVSVALMVLGTFVLFRRWANPWVSALLTIPFAVLQAVALLYAASATVAVIILMLMPPI